MTADQHVLNHRERIIQGKENWWFLGAGGVARLSDRHLASDGALAPRAERQLRAQGLYVVAPRRSYSLTVLTTTACNLGCGYCFQNVAQDEGSGSRPPRIAQARLTSSRITSVLEFARRQMAAAELEKLHIMLFGGEPLLNPRGCRELLARAADYGLTDAAMTSNLTLLTPEIARELADLGLRSVQVTFDGAQPDHDLIRIRRSGGGTYDAIVANLAAASAAAPEIVWSLRVNVSHRNVEGIDALLEQLTGAVDPACCRVYFARVGDVGIGYLNGARHDEDLVARFCRWQRRAVDLGFIATRPRAHTPCATCQAGVGRYGAVVNADGTLSSCWETAGKPDWQVGTVTGGYRPAEQISGRWIACEDTYQYGDERRAVVSFHDAVDADLLDYLHATGRL